MVVAIWLTLISDGFWLSFPISSCLPSGADVRSLRFDYPHYFQCSVSDIAYYAPRQLCRDGAFSWLGAI
jgi:hypothetical protein